MSDMHADLRTIFDYFKDDKVAIVGSSVKDFDTAHDIDVLVPAGVDYKALTERLGVKYNGFESKDGSHIRRANLSVPGVKKNVQLVQNRLVDAFEEWPHALMQRDGTVLKEGKFYDKPRTLPSRPARLKSNAHGKRY